MCNARKCTIIHNYTFIYIIIRSSVDSKGFGSNLSIIDPVQKSNTSLLLKSSTVILHKGHLYIKLCERLNCLNEIRVLGAEC